METLSSKNRLDYLMGLLEIRASQLAEVSGVDHSLITKWRRGERQLSQRSKQLLPLARGLLQLDAQDRLTDILAPYRRENFRVSEDLAAYLIGRDMPTLAARLEPPTRPLSGEYIVQHRVYLGKKGMRSATIAMLDYVLRLPPGREIVAVCHGNFNWIIGDLGYVFMLIDRLRKAFERGTTLTVVNRKGFAISDVAMFAGPWMIAHLRGYIRSLYYEGEMPPGDCLVASIRDYWSLRMREDDEVEDGLYITMYSDPVDIRQDVRLCDQYRARAQSLTKYDVLQNPAGHIVPKPAQGIITIQRTPSISLTSRQEFLQLTHGERDDFPEFFFAQERDLPHVPMRIIFCREDLREALGKTRFIQDMFAETVKRRVFVRREMLVGQLQRIIAALRDRDDVEVALVPRLAFERIGLEMAAYKDSAMLVWLSDSMQTVYSEDEVMSGSIYGYGEFIWGTLLAGWKRKSSVLRLLLRWLREEGLDEEEAISAQVRGWDPLKRIPYDDYIDQESDSGAQPPVKEES